MPSFSRSRPEPRNRPRNDAERRAARWYRLHGYRILDTNCWLADGELDLVARRGRWIVFCEVKSLAGDGWGDPLDRVDRIKIGRIRRAAAAWLARHPDTDGLAVRFDVIAARARRIEHVPHAF